MSGGAFNYEQYKLAYIADEIDGRIINNDDEILDEWGQKRGRGYSPEVIDKLKYAVYFLRLAQIYAHRADWLFSGDDGEEAFLRRLEKEIDEFGASRIKARKGEGE